MATFVCLGKLTDQGARNIKDSPDRPDAFRAMAAAHGVTIKRLFYTVGGCDLVTIVEGSEEAAAGGLAKLASLGNVRTETMRAFSVEEMRGILSAAT